MAAAGGFGQWRGAAAGAAASLLVTWLLSQPQRVAADRLAAHYLLPYLSDSPPSSQVTVEFCNLFRIVEKPYYVIFASCWVCALMQQLIDTSRYYEERYEELSKTQKCYVGIQLLTLVMETLAIVGKIDWLAGESLWHMYNLYVYVFVHSSVFVRSIMMSMIIWDWLLARLLGRPVFGAEYDGQGWRDWHRAVLLIIIMQFGSSVFVMMVVTLTHAIPALIIYYPVFLLAAAFIIKFRSWLELLGLNPDGRAGRGLVMASNSFVAVVSIQTMIASIIRVYFGDAWSQGYLAPLKDDVASRSSKTFYECHLRAGMGSLIKICTQRHISWPTIIALALAFDRGVGSRLASSQESVVGQCPYTTWPRRLRLLHTKEQPLRVSGH